MSRYTRQLRKQAKAAERERKASGASATAVCEAPPPATRSGGRELARLPQLST